MYAICVHVVYAYVQSVYPGMHVTAVGTQLNTLDRIHINELFSLISQSIIVKQFPYTFASPVLRTCACASYFWVANSYSIVEFALPWWMIFAYFSVNFSKNCHEIVQSLPWKFHWIKPINVVSELQYMSNDMYNFWNTFQNFAT